MKEVVGHTGLLYDIYTGATLRSSLHLVDLAVSERVDRSEVTGYRLREYLKFAERVSGVELGAARSNKESKDIRDLMEQVASLKGKMARKDEEIERLQLLKDMGNQSPGVSKRHGSNSLRLSSSSPGLSLLDFATQHKRRSSSRRAAVPIQRSASDPGNSS
ncbi:uncharacterized protein A4U43_C06F7500 [Asparagus officinalis]|uniref:Uncharacterized protein n=1 Tax=Asparagus officinalis TaxID=4686 RepID=A0A5P1EK82_ASPOF|nr:uncharacterized protein A4U43_C06F7500 [Asparagus officinalis]